MAATSEELHSAGALNVEAARVRTPSVCFVGIHNLSVLAPEYDPRGAAGEPVQHTLLARALSRRGYRVSMVTGDFGQPDGAVWDGVTTFKAFAPRTGLPGLRYIHPRLTRLWSALARANADAYYVSCAGGLVGQVALFCALRKRRLIFRAASDADCAPDALLIEQHYWRESRLYRFGLRRAAGVLVQSQRQRALMQENFGVSSTIAGLIVEAAAAPPGMHDRDIDALWVSNLRTVKRPDVMLGVAATAPEIRVHMVGGEVPGGKAYFNRMHEQAKRCANVTFHGATPYREVGGFYRRARVFVNTSDVEGFPNTYLQAWASGTPVVAFFDPDGVIAREGLGAAVRTPEEMVEAVRRLARDERTWRQISERCLRFIEREYGEERVLKPYCDLITRV